AAGTSLPGLHDRALSGAPTIRPTTPHRAREGSREPEGPWVRGRGQGLIERLSTTSTTYHSRVTFPVQVGPASITINRDDRFLVCQPDGRILGGPDDGFFTRDTRLLSGWDLRINGQRPLLLNSAPIQFFSARFEYSNEALLDDTGPIARQTLSIRL